MQTPEIFDTGGAASYVGLAPNTLEKMRTFGTGPRYAKLGRAVRYRRADLDAYINDRLVSSTSEQVAA
ncbi:helix-turn-helix domain-containing protein [Sphingopyxis granuli]|uniref:helix-turn-helix transcriptional regulator n=1 Tax=Sphingopyxis granuli TaxID=267128 RepID=UPI001F52D885|nr:helix-turn-helix domain-containing protein [Sphingopyxis granuli]UNK77898.1 helix-turn-helix domain-containing protein [Sphingopyxis granuli]